jgi:hypothetical protein
VGTLDRGCRRMRRNPDRPKLWSCSRSCVLLARVVSNLTVHGLVQQGAHLAIFSSCGVPASIEYRTRPLSPVSGGFDSRFPVLLFLWTYKASSGTLKVPSLGGLVLALLLPSMISSSARFIIRKMYDEELSCSLRRGVSVCNMHTA